MKCGSVTLPVLRVAAGSKTRTSVFRVGDRTVLDAARDDDELAGSELDDMIAELDAKGATHTEEELVLMLVVVPDEGTTKLDQLHLLTVELPDDLGPPVLCDLPEFRGKIHLVHGSPVDNVPHVGGLLRS